MHDPRRDVRGGWHDRCSFPPSMATEPIVVDGANVAWEWQTDGGKPRVSNIVAVKSQVEELGFQPIIIVDASLKHRVDDPDQLEGLFNQAKVLQAPSGTAADYFVLRTADEHGAQVVSNDEFEPYRDEFPWIKKRRVPFMIVEGSVQLYRPKLDLPEDAAPEEAPSDARRLMDQPEEPRREKRKPGQAQAQAN